MFVEEIQKTLRRIICGFTQSDFIHLVKPKYYPGKWKFCQVTRCNEWNAIIISLHTRETICDTDPRIPSTPTQD